MTLGTIVAIIVGLLLAGAIFYWQIIVAEGAYLGQPLVTWLYDLTAPRYVGIKQFDQGFESYFLGRPLTYALRNHPAPFVLDIATGSGRLPLTLLEQASFQGKIVGVDASRPMILQAASRLQGYNQVHLIWRDARDVPFADGTFDAVTMLEMLEFTPNPARQLLEAVRLVRPGGVLMTTRRRGLDARLMPGKTLDPERFTALLESLGMHSVAIQAWQVDYDLVWAWKPGDVPGGSRPLVEVLLCPACRSTTLAEESGQLVCEKCGRIYKISEGVIDLHQ